ncbi:MAG TPA: hypothetical protein VFV52_02205 [Bacilli bacterium]|nr:hypothetical protein [Bacilli bacterium]
MRKPMTLVATLAVSALLFAGCSQQTADPQQQPKPPQNNGGGTGDTAPQPPTENNDSTEQPGEQAPTADKTDDEIQTEIKGKLARLTDPSGYTLPVDATGHVENATSLDDVAELLRKKGYTHDLAVLLAHSFYKENAGAVEIIATDGRPGIFQAEQDATFTKKNKYVWHVEQQHTDNGLWEPHTAIYEIEVLRDGSYRLNLWDTRPLDS